MVLVERNGKAIGVYDDFDKACDCLRYLSGVLWDEITAEIVPYNEVYTGPGTVTNRIRESLED